MGISEKGGRITREAGEGEGDLDETVCTGSRGAGEGCFMSLVACWENCEWNSQGEVGDAADEDNADAEECEARDVDSVSGGAD